MSPVRAVAEIRRRDVLQSTAGPLEHVGIICVARHTFFLPAAVLDQTADGTSTTSDVYHPSQRCQPAGGELLPPLYAYVCGSTGDGLP